MPANKSLILSLPANAYELTDEDRDRFAQEERLGMVRPQDPVLTKLAQSVSPDNIASAHVKDVIEKLLAVAYGQRAARRVSRGKRRTLVGLAAPQIGQSLRIIVMDPKIGPDRKHPGKLVCFINPEIVWRSRETAEDREGCFSAGPVWGLVRRPLAVKIRAFTQEGKHVERIFEGFTARIACHEIDHLDGVRFPERITTDRKRHWVHAEELDTYIKHTGRWPRICTKVQWEAYKREIQKPGNL